MPFSADLQQLADDINALVGAPVLSIAHDRRFGETLTGAELSAWNDAAGGGFSMAWGGVGKGPDPDANGRPVYDGDDWVRRTNADVQTALGNAGYMLVWGGTLQSGDQELIVLNGPGGAFAFRCELATDNSGHVKVSHVGNINALMDYTGLVDTGTRHVTYGRVLIAGGTATKVGVGVGAKPEVVSTSGSSSAVNLGRITYGALGATSPGAAFYTGTQDFALLIRGVTDANRDGIVALVNAWAASIHGSTIAGPGHATPAGVEATSELGTAVATGKATIGATGVEATAELGTATATGQALASPAGVEATTELGAASATGEALAAPAGVEAIAEVGTATATGSLTGLATPTGVEATAEVGTATAIGGTPATAGDPGVRRRRRGAIGRPDDDWRAPRIIPVAATARPRGVRLVCEIGGARASGRARLAPVGAGLTAELGAATATGIQNPSEDELRALLIVLEAA